MKQMFVFVHALMFVSIFTLAQTSVSEGKVSKKQSHTSAHIPEGKMDAYLMVYFKEHGHNVYFAVSNDGYTFVDVNNGEPVMAGDTIAYQKGIRDPHIYREGQTMLFICH